MKTVNPYLYFNGKCEEAFTFYQDIFGGELQMVRYGDLDDDMNAKGEDSNKIANSRLPINDHTALLGSDIIDSAGPEREYGNDFYINLEIDTEEEADRIFHELSSDGKVEMPLQDTGWSEKFGMVSDPFGIQWMVMFTGNEN